MQNSLQLSGYVLHKRAYRETSLIVDFFSFEHGRISAVAKGARGNSKSDRKSLLQPFQKLEFELGGRSNLKNLGRVESLLNSLPLAQTSLYCGLYLNEILSRALPEVEPMGELFNHYESTLTRLSVLPHAQLSAVEPILREFEFTLLQTLGYLPDFTYEADTGDKITANNYYMYNPQHGFQETHDANKRGIKGDYILSMANADYDNEHAKFVRQTAKYICRLTLIEVIGTKPIKSRELFL